MSGPSGSSGTGTGSTANVYTPTAQPQADVTFQSLVNPMAATGLQGINQVGAFGSPYANAYSAAMGFQPSYLPGSPYAQQGQQAAGAAAGLGSQVLTQGQQGGAALFGAGMGALPYANQIMGTAFDPQSALFNQQQNLVGEQANVANAMAGVGGTPYGASTTANALGNFDINWQNNELARQAQGAGAYNSLLGAANQGMTGGEQLTLGGGLGSTQLGMLPYTTNAQISNNALSGLGTTAGLGQSAYQLPQQALNDLQSYLGLGQAASQLSGQLGQMGINQLAGGIGGGLAGANALFGTNSLFGGSSGIFGSGGIGSLFGGGAGATGGLSASDVSSLDAIALSFGL